MKGKKTGGRQKGTPNKLNAALKDMILEALNEAGGVDYLVKQAKKRNPGPFLALVGKVLPLQVTGANGTPLGPRKVVVVLKDGTSNAPGPPGGN